MLNCISSACIVQAGQAGPLYVNTKISMTSSHFDASVAVMRLPCGADGSLIGSLAGPMQTVNTQDVFIGISTPALK